MSARLTLLRLIQAAVVAAPLLFCGTVHAQGYVSWTASFTTPSKIDVCSVVISNIQGTLPTGTNPNPAAGAKLQPVTGTGNVSTWAGVPAPVLTGVCVEPAGAPATTCSYPPLPIANNFVIPKGTPLNVTISTIAFSPDPAAVPLGLSSQSITYGTRNGAACSNNGAAGTVVAGPSFVGVVAAPPPPPTGAAPLPPWALFALAGALMILFLKATRSGSGSLRKTRT
jgi:hypothetical protein